MNKRQMEEILFLLRSQGEKLTEGKLAENFGISRRTVGDDIKKIAVFFASKGIHFDIKPKIGIILRKITREKKISIKSDLEKKLQSETKFNKRERFILILIHCLLTPKIPTIEDWSERLNTSRTTIIKDIAEIKRWIKSENLKLVGKPGVGFKLIGEEKNIRDALVDFLLSTIFQDKEGMSLWRKRSSLTNLLNDFNLEILSNIHSFEIRNFINRLEDALETAFLYEDYIKFLLYISVSLRRIREGKNVKIEPKEMANIVKKPEFDLIKKNIDDLCKMNRTRITDEEIAYITERFMTLRFHSKPRIFNSYERSTNTYAKYLAESAEEILGIPFAEDEEFIQLVSAHLRMFFSKIYHGIKVVNPFFEEIKVNCPLLLKVSERICKECAEKFNVDVLSQEAQCIALYLLEEIEKMKHVRKKRIAVLCPQSMAITHFLKWRLENNIPEVEITIAKSCIERDRIDNNEFLGNIDLILSTSPIPLTKIPVFIIPRFLSEDYVEKIRTLLNINYSAPRESSFYIKNLFSKRFIFFLKLSPDKKDIFIKHLYKELYRRGYVRKNALKEIYKAGLNFFEEPRDFAFLYVSASVGVKPGVAIIKNYIKAKAVVVPIFVNNKEMSLKVLKTFGYLIRKNGLGLKKLCSDTLNYEFV